MRGGPFKELIVWQKSRLLAVKIYFATKDFPKDEIYGLRNQLRRAIVSVPSNIAEGHRRGSKKEFLQFLKIARGSLAEAETQIILSTDLKYVHDEISEQLLNDVDEIGRMLSGLIASLNKDG
jgi:four helix bundle protein